MERQLSDYELVCYEKNDEVGGTWLQNRYPGCACDVPAHIYTYTFEPNPRWKSYYAYAPEIQEYFVNFCDKYGLREYIKFNHKVLSAVWHEGGGQWKVQIEHNGQVFTDWCHVLVNGSGLLNKWKWPDIEGLHSFKGALMHSAEWDRDYDYSNKRVAVIGNGSSGIQIIPQLQKTAAQVKCVMRGTTWVAPPMPRVPVDVSETGKDAEFDDEEAVHPNTGQYFYTTREVESLVKDADYHLDYRKRIEYGINANFSIFYKDSEASRQVEAYMRAEMNRRLQNDPVLTKKLIPKWDVGCRRLTPGDGFLEALIKPNVECLFGDISLVSETGITMADGSHHEVDMVVCATGYDMAWKPHFTLVGRKGVDLDSIWGPVPKCYLGIAHPGFPNYFVMNGPRANLANGTVLPCLETEIEYVIQAVKKMQSDRIKSLDIRERLIDQLDEYIDAWHETSVFSGNCRSWYKDGSIDGKVNVWGGSSVHFLKTLKTARWEHYDIQYMDENVWSFLGNGRIKAECDSSFEGLTAYLRNSDSTWSLT
ncbi:unnamed protein product [Clonostachys rosea f. rosea IK726]|uniref:Uncharacterized protein n=2 Tax=Bionectria ochroleuca TaxID=29856 RepID=A0A0B7KAC9_BIOOC|nr:unnamed protein product [Clonostachys rosea f. rosea IK726]